MGRKPLINNDQVLAAARDVFLEHGAGAKMSHVAEQLGVSEAAIFKRFGTRDYLFAEAMRPEDDLPPFIEVLENRLGTEPFEVTMYETGITALEFCRVIAPVSMMVWANPSISTTENTSPPPITSLNIVIKLLERKMKSGDCPKFEADAFARTYLGGIYAYALLELLQPPKKGAGEEYVKASLSMILNPLYKIDV